MSAQRAAIGQATAGRRAKDALFRVGLFGCLALAVGLLAVLLIDVAIDGAGTLDWHFVNSFTSISADKAGIQAALWTQHMQARAEIEEMRRHRGLPPGPEIMQRDPGQYL